MKSKGTKLFLSAIILISALMFVTNLKTSSDLTGKAFYIAEGNVGIAEPGKPLPQEMININTVFWGIVLALMLIYIATMHLFEIKHTIPVHTKSKHRVVRKKK